MLESLVAGTDGNYARLRSPGRIQGFGTMLALHPRTLRVLIASENVGTELGILHKDVLGRPLTDFIGPAEAVAELRDAVGAEYPTFLNPLPVDIAGRRFDLILHAHDGLIFAELERLPPGAPGRADQDRLNEAAIMGMIVPDTMESLLEAGPRAIREATDFDRVMLYRFDEAYRGQVVGEALRPGIDSFMGLFFPEADIGAPARQLYEENFCRYIPQISGASFRVLPAENPLTGRALDMSHSVLRGIAPCHTEYLANMGIGASMSFSIVSEGRLWGLFACHHYQQAHLSYVQRLVCEQIAMMFTAKLEQLVNPEALVEDMTRRRASVMSGSPILRSDPLGVAWNEADEAALMGLVEADGAAIYLDGRVGKIGICPDFSDLHEYIRNQPDAFGRLVRMYDDDGLFYSNSIAAVLPYGDKMREKGSGMLVIPLSRSGRDYLMWFRPELVVKATWGGNPSERHGTDPNARFSPRRSFAAWKEDIRDRAAPWTPLQIANAVALRDHLLSQRP
jgi:light-regulated signal transduction histidine kinase (bacteriophytochrome)